jgi:hypothetical protein
MRFECRVVTRLQNASLAFPGSSLAQSWRRGQQIPQQDPTERRARTPPPPAPPPRRAPRSTAA